MLTVFPMHLMKCSCMPSAHLQRGGGFFVAKDGVAKLVGCNTHQNIAYTVCWPFSNFHQLYVHLKCPRISSAHLQSGGGFFVGVGGVTRLVGCNTFKNEATNVCGRHANLSRPLFDRANSCS